MRSQMTLVWTVAGSMALAGCATSFGAKTGQTQEIKTQLSSIESQVSTINQRLEEISKRQGTLEAHWQGLEQARRTEAASLKKAVASPSRDSSISNHQVQLALKSAGFYTGPIDGKLGSQTKEAVKAFQRSNHLTPDGVIGTRTSVALAKYLEKSSE